MSWLQSSREQLAIAEFATALLSIPKALSVNAAQDAYQIANNRYRGGLATYLDVLTAEDALLGSQRALVNLQSRAFSLDVALIHALGGGYQAPRSWFNTGILKCLRWIQIPLW